MKIILRFLFVVQLVLASFYGTLFLRGHNVHVLLTDDIVQVTLNFDDDLEAYEQFLELVRASDLHVSRVIYLDETHIVFYTTDLTLGDVIELRSGRLPNAYTSEFISTVETKEVEQVGIIANLVPGYHIDVSGIANPQNFALDGTYYLHTNDLQLAHQLVYELNMFILSAEVSYFNFSSGMTNFLTRGLTGFSTLTQTFEFALTSVVMFLIVLASSIQFVISRLKASSVLLLHGYSKRKVINLTLWNLLIIFSTSMLIAYTLLLCYMFYIGMGVFVGELTIYFVILSVILMLVYVLVANGVLKFYLKRMSSMSLIKGRKPYLLMQFLNQGLKIAFTFFFLVTFNFSTMTLAEMNTRLEHLSNWEIARNTYRINTLNVGNLRDDFEIERMFSERKINFYNELSEHHNGFIMDSTNFDWYDEGLAPDQLAEFSPWDHSVTISPNFLNLNPIETVNGIEVNEQLIFDDYVLNILIPERLMPYEEELVSMYLEHFYSQTVTVSNIYNRDLGLPINETTMDELSINVIYVKDNQFYFSFDYYVSLRTGGHILDPIAMIYTGNFDASFLSAQMTSSMYFQTDAINAYEEILPLLMEHGLESAIPFVVPVFDQNRRLVTELQEELFRLVAIIAILIVANLTVTYNLVANYFERNKFKLTLKEKFGYSVTKRNQWFIIGFLVYMIPLNLWYGSVLGSRMLLVGFAFLVIDVLMAYTFERYLQRKSYAELMKGER